MSMSSAIIVGMLASLLIVSGIYLVVRSKSDGFRFQIGRGRDADAAARQEAARYGLDVVRPRGTLLSRLSGKSQSRAIRATHR